MVPVEFKGSNAVYAKDQPEYVPLPAFKAEDGIVVSCWKLSLWERLKLLITGKLWFMQHTFNEPLQPQFPTVKCPLAWKKRNDKNEHTV